MVILQGKNILPGPSKRHGNECGTKPKHYLGAERHRNPLFRGDNKYKDAKYGEDSNKKYPVIDMRTLKRKTALVMFRIFTHLHPPFVCCQFI